MNCRGCGGANRDGARFCTFCGAVLTLTCSSCGTDLLEGARFCDSCGTPVALEPAAEPVAAARKVVTVLFADMTGSTSLEEEMDAEAVRSLVDRFYAALRAEVDKRGGRVVKFTGDGLMAAFGVPEVHEDDAARAIEAALAMCVACEDLATQTGHSSISLKVGVNTGEVVVIEDDDDVVGDSVNVAARLEGAAQAGEVLVGEGTWRLTRATSRYEPIEPLVLKGKADPVAAYRLLDIDEAAVDSVATPFVGRADELELLVSVFDEAVAANAARLVTIVGSPGLGKTRLTRELAVRLADRALVRETRCDPAGSATFAPIAETLRAAASIPDTAEEEDVIAALEALIPADDPDRERIASRAAAIFGVGSPGSTEETFWALRRLIETAARDHPRVLVLDDLHWGEPMLLDLVEHLAEWIHDAPVLLVGTGRPELRDIRPSLVEGGRASAVISLEGLDERATEQLALGMLGTNEVPRELLAKIPASTDGNPLFVRELVRMLIDDGVLRRDGDAWTVTVDVDAIEVPPTIQSLLAARMDRLRGDERTVIELASVIGKEFYRGAIHALAPSAVREQLDACLESLRRKELVEPVGAFWIDEPVFRFHHALIRDAAYRRLLKESRADLHERVADWLEEKTGDVIGEHEEIIGYHLEQAHEYHRQLGRLDDRATALGRRAAALLGLAAQRALDRDDLPAAATLSGRALTRLPVDDHDRPALLIVRVEALLSMGDVVSGRSAVVELERLTDSPRLSAWATCFAGQLANLVEPERLRETEKRVAAAASELAELGDPAGAAKAHTVHASTLARLGRFAECETALDEALTAAREAGDRRRVTAVLGAAPLAALWGPSPVSRAGGRCLDIVRLLRITTGSPAVEATSTRCQAVLEAFRGRADAARKMLRNARGTLEELGLRHELLETEQFAGIVELVAGDPAAAESHLRTAHDGFRFVGVDVSAAQSAALLARAHLQLGEIEEAESFAEESERLAGQDLKASISWRAVMAEVLARRGAFEEARRLAESAVEIASRTDALIDHGDACRALSVVCAAAGDRDGARSVMDRAFALYERKGATALLEAGEPYAAVEEPGRDSDRADSGLAENECLRVLREFLHTFEVRDWGRLTALHREDFSMYDRRPGLSSTYSGRDAQVESLKATAEIGTTEASLVPLATRGNRLSLVSSVWRGPTATAFGAEFLAVSEIDEDGRIFEIVVFRVEDFDAALAELDERFIAGEGAAHAEIVGVWSRYVQAYNGRDWAAFRALLSDDVVVVDERPASLGRIEGVETYLVAMAELIDLIPGRRGYVSNLPMLGPDGGVVTFELSGATADGAVTTETMHNVGFLRDGRLSQTHHFPPEQLGAAIARFREVGETSATPASRLENACTQVLSRVSEAFATRDWERCAEAFAEDVVHEDRRSVISDPSVGRAEVASMIKSAADIGTVSIGWEPIATRGQRLALFRVVMRGRDVGTVAFGMELLQLVELDERGLVRWSVSLDEDSVDAAFAELDERYIAGEGAPHADVLGVAGRLRSALNDRDYDDLRLVFSGDLVVHDHRPASLGVMHGADEWIESAIALNELASIRTATIACHSIEHDRILFEGLNRGVSNDGADFESAFQVLLQIRDARIARFEVFPLDQLDAALTRFDELGGTGHSQPSNASVEAVDRELRLSVSRNWNALSAVLAETVTMRDRRQGFRFEYVGREVVVEAARALDSIGAITQQRDVVAIRGTRLALMRLLLGPRDRPGFESEVYVLNEIDEAGRSKERMIFDPADLDSALEELDERYRELGRDDTGLHDAYENAASRAGERAMGHIVAADWGAFNAVHSPTVRLEDRRSGLRWEGTGRQALLDRASEHSSAYGHVITSGLTTRGDRLALGRQMLTSRGSEAWESERLVLYEIDDHELLTFIAFFDPTDLDAAFSELDERYAQGEGRPFADMVRGGAEIASALNARDWVTFASFLWPDVVLIDHRQASMGEIHGRDELVRAIRELAEIVPDVRHTATRVHAIGTNTSVVEWLVQGTNVEGGAVEISYLQVGLARDGRGVRIERYAVEQIDAALERFEELALEHGMQAALESEATQLVERTLEARLRRDWDEFVGLLAPDCRVEDRRAGLRAEFVGRDAMLEQVQATGSVGMDAIEFTCLATRGERLELDRRTYGSSDRGTDFAVETLTVCEIDEAGRFFRGVVFDREDLDAAFAELDERFLAYPQVPEATRLGLELLGAYNGRDWEQFQALLTEDFVLVDHRPVGRGTVHGGEDYMALTKGLIELVPDVRMRLLGVHHEQGRLMLATTQSHGTDEHGNSVEYDNVNILRGSGRRISRLEFFLPEQFRGASVRFDELRAQESE